MYDDDNDVDPEDRHIAELWTGAVESYKAHPMIWGLGLGAAAILLVWAFIA